METNLILKVEKPVNDTVSKANAITIIDTPTRIEAGEAGFAVK